MQITKHNVQNNLNQDLYIKTIPANENLGDIDSMEFITREQIQATKDSYLSRIAELDSILNSMDQLNNQIER